MARKSFKPEATKNEVLECVQQYCLSCRKLMWNEYDNYRHVRTLEGVVQLRLKIRCCQNKLCERYRIAYRPEQEASWALPQQEFGLDIIALVGALRYQEHRSVPQIHQYLKSKGVEVSERSVTHLLARYDELVCLWLKDHQRLKAIAQKQGRVILAIDGMQPEVGNEVLWVIRDCLSGEILLAKTLLSSRNEDLVTLLLEVSNTLNVQIDGVVSDGQQSIRKAVELALPGIAHGLCHFHYLKEAAKVVYEADRHAKKELKKRVRGIRKIERSLSNSDEKVAQVINGYCLAVRGSLTSDGRPPLDASGLKLQERLTLIEQSLERAFGVLRHHQRRCTGRKVAPSSLVIRGSVQLASAIATALRPFTAEDLAQVCVDSWLNLRSDLQKHHKARIEQLRFRRNPNAYLASLESQLL